MNTSARPLKGKTVLITGATSGIGKATALGLASLGARLVLAGRSDERCRDTLAEIKRVTGNPRVDFLVADLSILSGMRKLTSDFLTRYDRLHVLVNNAGAFFTRRFETEDGFELTFALNHLSYFLVTNLLLNALRKSAPARIINTSSGIYKMEPKMPFDDLQTETGYAGLKAYGRSKLANLLFTYELARRLEDTGITVNAVDPGFTATGLGMPPGGFGRFTRWMFSKMAKSAEEAAKTFIYLASSAEVETVTGRYFENLKQVSSSRASYDPNAQARLWKISEEMTGLKEKQGDKT